MEKFSITDFEELFNKKELQDLKSQGVLKIESLITVTSYNNNTSKFTNQTFRINEIVTFQEYLNLINRLLVERDALLVNVEMFRYKELNSEDFKGLSTFDSGIELGNGEDVKNMRYVQQGAETPKYKPYVKVNSLVLEKLIHEGDLFKESVPFSINSLEFKEFVIKTILGDRKINTDTALFSTLFRIEGGELIELPYMELSNVLPWLTVSVEDRQVTYLVINTQDRYDVNFIIISDGTKFKSIELPKK